MRWIPENFNTQQNDTDRQSLFNDWLHFARRLDWSEPHHQDSELLAFSTLQKVMRSLSPDRRG
ncbi:MAG: hypothetical protein WED00_18825 [Aquisalimonadaceae bacterium]